MRRVSSEALHYPATRDGKVITVTDFEATLENPPPFEHGEPVVIMTAAEAKALDELVKDARLAAREHLEGPLDGGLDLDTRTAMLAVRILHLDKIRAASTNTTTGEK